MQNQPSGRGFLFSIKTYFHKRGDYLRRFFIVGLLILTAGMLLSCTFQNEISQKQEVDTYTVVSGESRAVEGQQKEVMYYTDEDVEAIAKLLYAECRGVKSRTEQACVAWVVLNRVDNGFAGETIQGIITYPGQFHPISNVTDPVPEDLYTLAGDVLSRWNSEKNGIENVGRVLPKEYTYFTGDGKHNYFRNAYRGGTVWDFTLESPYEN